MFRNCRRLCSVVLALLGAAYATSTSAQVSQQTDAQVRIVDPFDKPLPSTLITLRGSNGQVINPQTEANGEFVFVNVGRKINIELTLKGLKTRAMELVLEQAPVVYISMMVDPYTGQIKEVRQKPHWPMTQPAKKIKHAPGGQQHIMMPPPNDACATPTPIFAGATAFSTATATTDGPANCLGQIYNDTWYSYVATGTGTLTVSTCSAATFDTKLAIYSGLGCPPGVPIGCNDDFGGCTGFTSIATAPVTIGGSYLIRVGAFGSTSTGSGTLTITPPVGPPANDECAGATTVACGSSTVFSNSAATTAGSDPAFSCRFGAPGQGFGTVWFKFVATGTNATADTNGSLTSDTMIAVYSGTCGSLTEIGCDDDSGTGLLSSVTVGGLTVGTTYYIQVAGYGAGNVGTNTLNLACFGTPAGDDCDDPIVASCDSAVDVDLTLMTTDAGDPAYSCRFGAPGQGVGTAWISFVATNTSVRVDTNDSVSASDTMLALYSGSCGSLVELCCDDDTGLGLLSEFCCEGLTVGNTYLIQVSSYDAFSLGEATVTIECPCPAPPANDECENAIAIAGPLPTSITFDTSLATDDIGIPCNLFSGPFNNVWYSLTGTGNTITATSCNGGTTHPDTKIAVYCGECLEPICVTGNDDSCGGGGPIFASTVSWCSQAGSEYLITVGGFASGQMGVVQLDISDNGVACDADVECRTVGACCLEDGTCAVLAQADCEAAGGTYQGDDTACTTNAIVDGGFEGGAFGGNWNEFSTNFGTPLCDASCGFGGGTGPNSGSWWAWFGGIFAFEEGSVDQTVTIPVGATTLDFMLEIPVSSGNGVDFLEVNVDGNQEYLVLESAGTGPGYFAVSVPIGAYADGGSHNIEFHSIITGDDGSGNDALSNFFVDDVSLATELISCEVCYVLDFETDDQGNALGDKQMIQDGADFAGGPNYPVTITSAGNVGTACGTVAGTAAVYDSDAAPHGQDPDLAVSSGNILILQADEGLGACSADFYCSGNDDNDGGTVTFTFNEGVEAISIDLIDVDASGAAEPVTITLTDSSGDERVYTVPADWTGDIDAATGPGIATLLLDGSSQAGPGPGNPVATATTDAGYDPNDVVSIVVERGGDCPNVDGGSGALDNLTWCQ